MAQSIFDTQDEDLQDAYHYAQLPPHEQIALRQRQAEQGVAAGAENVLRGGLGLPTSQERNRSQAGLELRQLAQRIAPGTSEFYTAAIDILRKYGLVADAEAMAVKLNALELGKAGQHSPTIKLQRDLDELEKRKAKGDLTVQPGIDAIRRQLALLGTRSEGSKQADPEFIKLLDQYEAAIAAGQGDRAALIKTALDAWLRQHSGANKDEMTAYQKAMLALREREVGNKETKDADKLKKENAAIVSSLQGVVRALDTEVQAAERLLVHPGLGWITGARAGITGRVGAAANSDAAGAHALLLNVQAQTFIRALQDLKATSRTGASGLGQLTEREGDKIQNAKVALDAQQPTDQFKRTLASYIGQLKSARGSGAGELTGVQADVPAAPAPVSDKPAAAPKPEDVAPGAFPPKPAEAPTKRKLTATRVK